MRRRKVESAAPRPSGDDGWDLAGVLAPPDGPTPAPAPAPTPPPVEVGSREMASEEDAARAMSDFVRSPGLYGAVVERIFDLPDPASEYEALEKHLTAGLGEHDSAARALDSAEDRARRAHRLYVNAKLDFERFQADAEVVTAALRQRAMEVLQRQKDAGQRSKAITDADVVAQCAAMFPDEWRDLADRRARAKLALEHLERFSDLWMSRCRSLSALVTRR